MKHIGRYLISIIAITVLLTSSIDIWSVKNTISRPFCVSVTKCGSHLINKLLGLITNLKANPMHLELIADKLDSFNRVLQKLYPDHFFMSHLRYSPALATCIKQYNFSKFIMIRDPRDRTVSLAHWIKKTMSPTNAHIAAMPVSDIILGIINQSAFVGKNTNTYDNFRQILAWQEVPGFYMVRFENLVGPQGGGSLKAQHQEITKIAAHMNITLNQQSVEKIAAQLFGGTGTFRIGKIATWKDEFTPDHINAFRKKHDLMQLLIDLGYESNTHWPDKALEAYYTKQ